MSQMSFVTYEPHLAAAAGLEPVGLVPHICWPFGGRSKGVPRGCKAGAGFLRSVAEHGTSQQRGGVTRHSRVELTSLFCLAFCSWQCLIVCVLSESGSYPCQASPQGSDEGAR
jgi:hypothetical protein